METADLRPAIRLAAMDLLARREHSRTELLQKLGRRFEDRETIAEVLDGLAQDKLQSDSRYAESFARQRVLRGHGPLRLRQEMRQKGIPDDDASVALESLDVDWEQLAREVCQKKFGFGAPADFREKARRQRFLQYRGFSADQIAACLPW
ncbi:regulatory protein RecX [Parahaliea maris]|uniref:Regulatory protein RecX n=2 Tax=Parahaliea maris TaxID=2716870 RepID=A0A5C9A7A5_9GAMM|nr:regulatory protein RecX [Parahaliea maris]